MSEKKSFVIYDSWATLLFNLPTEQAGELIKAICSFQLNQKFNIEDPTVKAMYAMIRPKMEEDAESYSVTKQKRRDAINTRWRKNKTNLIQNDTNEYTCIHENTNVSDVIQKNSVSVSDSVSVYVSPNGDKEKTEKKENPLDETEPSAEGITVSDKPWDEFWSMYGKYKKAGEKYAMLAFNNAAITTDTSEILAGLKKVIALRWSKYPKEKMQFIPKAENWLKSESWKDDVDPYEPEKPKKAGVVMPMPKYPDSGPSKKASPEMIAAFKKKQQEYAS